MLGRLGTHVRDQWMGALSLFLVLTGGVAYAADTVFSTDIVDGEVKSVDIADNSVGTFDLHNNQLRSTDVRNDNFPGGGLTGVDIADFSLTNQDIGVHYAYVNTDGTVLASSNAGLIGTDVGGGGSYFIDFGLGDVSECGASATVMRTDFTGRFATIGHPNESQPHLLHVKTFSEAGDTTNEAFGVVLVC